jgi:xanthine dehydrogenase YagS FAD-binding subunit
MSRRGFLTTVGMGTATVMACGGMGGPPAEAELRGKARTADTARRAARAAVAGAAPLEHNGYKVPLLQGLLEEELLRLATAG